MSNSLTIEVEDKRWSFRFESNPENLMVAMQEAARVLIKEGRVLEATLFLTPEMPADDPGQRDRVLGMKYRVSKRIS